MWISIILGLLTFVLVIVSLFMIMVVLMQKAKSDGGMGSAMGGGMAEATFGADTGNVLSKATINSAIVFFVLSGALFLGRIYQHSHPQGGNVALPTLSAPLAPPPAATPAPSAAPAPAGPALPAPASGGPKP